MITDLATVNEDEGVDLIAFMMERRKIRHVLVEDGDHRLVGLVTYRALLRLVASGELHQGDSGMAAREIMQRDLLTVTPETTTAEAIKLLREHQYSILPVVQGDKLVGVVTETCFMPIASQLLEEKLKET